MNSSSTRKINEILLMKLNFLGAACDWLTAVEATITRGGLRGVTQQGSTLIEHTSSPRLICTAQAS